MITRVDKLIEKLSEFDDDTQIRIIDLSDDSGDTGVYNIKSVENVEVFSRKTGKDKLLLAITFEQF
jgi:hypothetical protein